MAAVTFVCSALSLAATLGRTATLIFWSTPRGCAGLKDDRLYLRHILDCIGEMN